jgi:uncharacterized protein
MAGSNPCLRCGACCALFKVAFDQTETDAHAGGIVPADYTVILNQSRCAMRGTQHRSKRCAALQGIVGIQVFCTIYERRPSCCQKFHAAWEKDIVNPICNRARVTYGLHPFDFF